MDKLNSTQRSDLMRKIRSTDTGPEKTVRSLVHAMGHRYRLHRKDLPGTPDLAFISKRKVIFIHGCFWHRHSCNKGQSQPSSNIDFWKEKLTRNRLRDKKNYQALKQQGWKVMTIWECQLKDISKVALRIEHFLST